MEKIYSTCSFFSIISLWEYQKFKLLYLENVLMKFRENFATAAACHHLPLIVSIEFIVILSAYGSAWRFLNFRHQKSTAISAGTIKVHCLRNGSFKFWIAIRIHTNTLLPDSVGTALRWKMFSAHGGAHHVPITIIITLPHFWYEFSMQLT